VFVLKAGKVTTPVKTDAMVAQLDDCQIGGKQGPCLDCMAEGTAVYAEDLARDPRWPISARRPPGPACAASWPVPGGEGTVIGALNLYARFPLAFGAVDRARGLVLAGLAGWPCPLAEAHDEELRRARTCARRLSRAS